MTFELPAPPPDDGSILSPEVLSAAEAETVIPVFSDLFIGDLVAMCETGDLDRMVLARMQDRYVRRALLLPTPVSERLESALASGISIYDHALADDAQALRRSACILYEDDKARGEGADRARYVAEAQRYYDLISLLHAHQLDELLALVAAQLANGEALDLPTLSVEAYRHVARIASMVVAHEKLMGVSAAGSAITARLDGAIGRCGTVGGASPGQLSAFGLQLLMGIDRVQASPAEYLGLSRVTTAPDPVLDSPDFDM